jgi:uncharacterized membrane protein
MLATVLLLLVCALTAIAGAPMILKLIPPNDVFGVRTVTTRRHERLWYEVHRFAGWALVAAAGLTALLLLFYTGTLLRPFWRQVLTYLVLLAVAAGATFWYERNVERILKARHRSRSRGKSRPKPSGA